MVQKGVDVFDSNMKLLTMQCRLGCGLVGLRNNVLDVGVHIGAIWQIRMYSPFAAAMRPYFK